MTTPNHRLAIVGRYSLSGPPRVTFSGDGLNTPSLSRPAWFCAIRPQYLSREGAVIKIGRQRYRARQLAAIASGTSGQPIDIPASSKLLEVGRVGDQVRDTHKRIQEAGAEYARELYSALETLSYFRHPVFDRLLLEVGGLALTPQANKVLREVSSGEEQPVIDEALIRRLFAGSQRGAHVLLGYFKCISADEENFLDQFRRFLDASREEAELDAARIDALVEAVQRTKSRLLVGPQIGSCPGEVLDSLSTEENRPWLADCRTDESQPLRGALVSTADGASATPKAGKLGFQAIFRQYHAANEEAQRILRTGPLRPFMNAFLFSKYRAHGMTDGPAAAKAMLDTGITSQPAPKPVISAETRKHLRSRVKEITDAPVSDESLRTERNFGLCRNMLRQIMGNLAEFDSTLTQAKLIAMHRGHTMKALGLAGGAMGKLIGEIEARKDALKPHLRGLLATKSGDGQTLHAAARSSLQAASRDEKWQAFVKTLFERIPESVAEPIDMLEHFVALATEEADRDLQERFAQQLDDIRADSARDDAVNLLRLHLAVCYRAGDCGVSHSLTPEMQLGLYPEEAELLTEPLRQSWIEAAEQRYLESVPDAIRAPVPEAWESLPEGVSHAVHHGGRAIGTVSREGEVVTVASTSKETAPLLASEKAVVDIEGGSSSNLIQAGVHGLEAFDPHQLPGHSVAELVDDLGRVGRKGAKIAERFADRTDVSEVAKELRASHVGTTLIECLLTSPPDSVDLGTPDLSQGLGFATAVLCTLPADDPDAFVNEPSEAFSRKLETLDVSDFFNAQSVLDMAREMQYHYEQCLSVDQIRDLLADIEEQAAFAEKAPRDLEVTYINQTLGEHAESPTTATQFFCRERPAVVYLSRQAFRDPSQAPTEFNTWVARLINAVGTDDVRLPIFVAPLIISDARTPVPVIDPRTNPLPRLVAGRKGLNPTPDDAVVVEDCFQEEPYLALAASLACEGGTFGTVSQPSWERESDDDMRYVFADIADTVTRSVWPGSLGVTPRHEAPVARLLHEAWFAPDPDGGRAGCHLLAELLAAKAFNLASAQGRKLGRPVSAEFEQLLKLALDDEETFNREVAGLPTHVIELLQSVRVKSAGAWRSITAEGGAGLADAYHCTTRGLTVRLPDTWRLALAAQLP